MDNVIELDGVDALGAGAIGEPGQRVFYIQADKSDARLTVVVEKEQVALLAEEAVAFLDRIGLEYPEEPAESATLHPSAAQVTALGGKILKGPTGGQHNYCVIEDPAGAICALYQG